MTKRQQLLDQAIDRHRQGRLDEAGELYAAMLAQDSADADAAHWLGVVRLQQGRPKEAADLIGQAAKSKPKDAALLGNLGTALAQSGSYGPALAAYDSALALDKGNAGSWNGRGVALFRLDRPDEAIGAFDRALAIDPKHGMAWHNRGNALAKLGRHEDAIASYDRSLQLLPLVADSHSNRGNSLAFLGRFGEAVESYERALSVNPRHIDALSNRGNALEALRRPEDALASYDSALALDPANVNARYNRGNARFRVDQIEEGLADLEMVRHDAQARNALAFRYASAGEWDKSAALLPELRGDVERGHGVEPFSFFTLGPTLEEQLGCAKNYIPTKVPASILPFSDWPQPRSDKIRIAYMSFDFRRHVVSFMISELFERHDHSQFEVIGISSGVDDKSDTRKRLVAAFDTFIDIHGVGDDRAVERIRQAAPDIIIDLSGHTEGSRYRVLGRRIAPIQAMYLGYIGTSGAPYIDYLISDATTIPLDFAKFYTEKIVHLPHCALVNDTKKVIAPHSVSRAAVGLPENGFVFSCFNDPYKIRPPMFDVWMRLLQNAPGSVLWLLDANPLAIRNLRAAAQQRGVEPERLIFAQRMELADHLARTRLADLFLDTQPVNAGATACDALWSGLPVLTCLGDTPVGRVCASVVRAAGMPDMVAEDLAGYEALALDLARNPERLAAVRARLAENRGRAPLFDIARSSRNIEAAYRVMVDRHRRGLPPEHFAVTEGGS